MAPTLKPMENPGTASWGMTISNSDFEKLKAGFKPQQMEDKWVVLATGPDQSGSIAIHCARSWTGRQFYILNLKPTDDNSAVVETLDWAQTPGNISTSGKQARREVTILCRNLLGCEFESLPMYDTSIFWNAPENDESEDEA